jgi:putative transposase
LDEVFVKINGVQHYLWRAVDHEGEVLEAFVSKQRDKTAALKFLKKLMKRHGRTEELVTDGLRGCCTTRAEAELAAFPFGLGDARDLGRAEA